MGCCSSRECIKDQFSARFLGWGILCILAAGILVLQEFFNYLYNDDKEEINIYTVIIGGLLGLTGIILFMAACLYNFGCIFKENKRLFKAGVNVFATKPAGPVAAIPPSGTMEYANTAVTYQDPNLAVIPTPAPGQGTQVPVITAAVVEAKV